MQSHRVYTLEELREAIRGMSGHFIICDQILLLAVQSASWTPHGLS